jgi:hypothetical protein
MKIGYKNINLKNAFFKFLFVTTSITSSIIIAFSAIFFISPVFKKNDLVPARIIVFGNELSDKIQTEINNAVSIYVENIYNRLLTNIQFSIALFSSALVIFAIVFGVIYFSKIREAENLIKEIQKTPDLFFKHFYKEQFNKNISNLFSQNYIKRNDAITNLTFNPEIGSGDYDVLRDVLLNELEYTANVYFHQNISTITSILMKIDYQKTISLLKKILVEQEYNSTKHYHLLSHIISDSSDETKKYIETKLLKDNEMGSQLVSALLNNGVLNDYMGYILEKCQGSILQMAITFSYSEMRHIKIDGFYEHLTKRKDIDAQCLYSIISHKAIDVKEKIAIVLYYYTDNTEKFEQALNNLISTISNDEGAKNDFLTIVNQVGQQELLREFFNKNKHLKSHFTNFSDDDIFKREIDENENKIKKSSAVIKERELHLSDDGATIIDKDGVKHEINQYSQSVFGPMFPVMSGVMIDGTFIDINELK